MALRPMKAYTIDESNLNKVRFPQWGSHKLDGIRGIKCEGGFQSNSGKMLPSPVLQQLFSNIPNKVDGEFIYGDPTHPHCYNLTQSAVMSKTWPAHLDASQLWFHAFDYVENKSYSDRLLMLQRIPQIAEHERVIICPTFVVQNQAEFERLYEESLALGYEGLMLRTGTGSYKQGRSTEAEQYLGKAKPYGKELNEARILDVYPLLINDNDVTIDSLGYQRRSSHADGKIEVDAIGGFVVLDLKTQQEFRIGSGKLFTKKFRYDMWKVRDTLVGKVVQYKSMQYGVKDKPRQPTAYRFRDPIDMTEY